ncbi:hypothetical protein D9611_013725 [Ephemerocybe angulata]|uniref:CCHC-type domain-containing protein n=1 Tax=Ephemerocybe angulata TaxID=980116 RepID=A0A8H5BC48_9AGAR|nr:hypothetical protein D9611_013725 [Tulosesus angulatus]
MSDRRLYTTIKTPLNDGNYHDWKFAVSIVMRHEGVWEVVSGEEPKPEESKEQEWKDWKKKADLGLTVIGLTVDPSQYTYIRDATDGADAWAKLKAIYEKNTRATRISLKQQFFGYHHNTNEPMQNYITGITDIASKLQGIGIKLADNDITDVMIFNLNSNYSSVASTLMASQGELTVADVSSALLEEERRKGGPPKEPGTDVYSLFGKARLDNRNRGNGANREFTCFRCGRQGHKMRECHARSNITGSSITPQMEEEAHRKVLQFQQPRTNYAVNINRALDATSLNAVTY